MSSLNVKPIYDDDPSLYKKNQDALNAWRKERPPKFTDDYIILVKEIGDPCLAEMIWILYGAASRSAIRYPLKALNGMKEIFDVQKVSERMEMGQVAGEVAFRAVGDVALIRQKDAVNRYQQAQEAFEQAQAQGDQAGMGEAMAVMVSANNDFAGWKDGGVKKTALHVVAGGLQAAFGGGNALAGALGAGANEVVSSQTENALLGFAAGLIGGAVGGSTGTGAATALAGHTYNRELHKEEKEAIERLMSEGYDRSAINAVACNVARCWEGAGLGVMADVVKEQTLAVMASITAAQQSELLNTLRAEAPGLFQYKLKDYLSDAWKENPGLQDGLTRTGGAVQALGGYGAAVVGGGLVAVGGATCLETGAGCFAAAGGIAMLGWGADQMTAGGATAMTGSQQPTLGGWALSQILEVSPQSGELAWGLAGLAPTAIEAYAVNKALNAEVAFNQLAQASYKPFFTNGVKATEEVMGTPSAQALITEIQAGTPGMSYTAAASKAVEFIESGATLPSMGVATQGSVMIKVVPKGDPAPTSHGYWMSIKEARAIASMGPEEAGRLLGLPAAQAARIQSNGMEFYAISPKPGATPKIFTSQIAEATQGSVSMTGGMSQVIVPNARQWTEAKKVDPFKFFGK